MIEKIILAAAAVFSILFAEDGQYIPAAVFAVLLIVSTLIPVKQEIKLILSAAFGFPLLIFASAPWTGAVTLLLLMTGMFYLAGQKLTVKAGIAIVLCAALGGLILYLPQIVTALCIVAGIVCVSAYCIFVQIHRMKKSLKVKVL